MGIDVTHLRGTEIEDKDSERVVSSTYLYSVGPAIRSSIKTIDDRGPSQDPWGIPPTRVVQDESHQPNGPSEDDYSSISEAT